MQSCTRAVTHMRPRDRGVQHLLAHIGAACAVSFEVWLWFSDVPAIICFCLVRAVWLSCLSTFVPTSRPAATSCFVPGMAAVSSQIVCFNHRTHRTRRCARLIAQDCCNGLELRSRSVAARRDLVDHGEAPGLAEPTSHGAAWAPGTYALYFTCIGATRMQWLAACAADSFRI